MTKEEFKSKLNSIINNSAAPEEAIELAKTGIEAISKMFMSLPPPNNRELAIEEILSKYGWNKMPSGTTEQQWRRYHDDMIVHEMRYEARKPNAKDYADDEVFKSAFSKWDMDRAMSMPNRPGYYRANND